MAAMLRAVYAQFAMEGAVDADAFDAMTRHMGTAFASRAALLAGAVGPVEPELRLRRILGTAVPTKTTQYLRHHN